MTFEEYQTQSRRTAKYPSIGESYVYPTLGLVGEAGEVSEKIKKIFRDSNGLISEEKRAEIKKELGDVLWYLSQLCTELRMNLDDVAASNLEKLLSRMERNALCGEGDNR